jgi:hypothetical protein
MLARAGADVLMIGRKAFVETVNRRGLLLDTVTFKEVVHVRASTEMNAVQGAEIVLFCVKTTDTVATAKILAPFLSPDTALLCRHALVFELAPRTLHPGLRVVAVAGDAFDGGFQQGDDPLFAAGVGGWTCHPDGLGLLGFHQEHQVERGRGFAGGGLHQQLIADELDFVVEGRVGGGGLGCGGIGVFATS